MAAFEIAVNDRRYLASISAAGFAKKTSLSEYPLKGRATGGVQAMGVGPKDALAGVTLTDVKDQLLVWTEDEECVRLTAKEIATTARDRKGSRPSALPREARPTGMARLGES